MKIKTLLYFSLQAIAAFFCFEAAAQVSKLGKVSDEELNMKVYANDSSAAAVVLFDVGRTFIDLTRGHYQMFYERHRRIKILSVEGYEYGNILIPVYHTKNKSSEEKLLTFKGFTHYNSRDGLEKTSFGKNQLVKEKLDDNRYLFKFSAPKVQVGTIIEYKYKIESDFFFYFKTWEFQERIPVAYSQYNAQIPAQFTYNSFFYGYQPFSENNNKEGNDKGAKWVIKNAPAIKSEAFVASEKNLVTKIEFQLASYLGNDNKQKNTIHTWDKLAEDLLNEEMLGKQMNKKGPMREVMEAIGTSAGTEAEKIAYAYENATKSIRWNGFNGIYGQYGIKQAVVKGEGNGADINLYLINTLRALDLDAHPVILSTRSHGKINEYYPQLEKFNYLIAYVKTAEGYLLIDAADTSVPLGQLPFKCLNGKGRLLKEGASDWILLASGDFNATYFTQISFTEDGKTKAAVKLMQKGYEASQTRKAIAEQGEKDFIKNTWSFASAGMELANHKVTGLEDKKAPLSIALDLQSEDGDEMGSMLYLNPFVLKDFDKNPFTMEERKFPVDFGAPQNYSYTTAIQIPDGYAPESIPQAISVNLPDGGGKFVYNAAVSGNSIQVTSKIIFSKAVYKAEEYALLKQFIAQIVAKQGEQVVLKKK